MSDIPDWFWGGVLGFFVTELGYLVAEEWDSWRIRRYWRKRLGR